LPLSPAFGRGLYRGDFQALPTLVYQVQGDDIRNVKSRFSRGDAVRSAQGGSVTLVNDRGYVEVCNGSRLDIVRATEGRVGYRAAFADVNNQLVSRGSVIFFVAKKKQSERFAVRTPDYTLEVVGTCFTLRPDVGGHVALSVKEGAVRTVFSEGDFRTIYAGQNLAYDLNANRYIIRTDGTIVDRKDVDIVPDIKKLRTYHRLCATTLAPGAEVTLDGRYIGTTPLAILQPAGAHTIRAEKPGYATLDTTVSIDSLAEESTL